MKYLVFMLSMALCSTASAQYYQSGGLFFSTAPPVYPAPVVHQAVTFSPVTTVSQVHVAPPVATVSQVTTVGPVITYNLPPQKPTLRNIFAPRASYVGSVQYRVAPFSTTVTTMDQVVHPATVVSSVTIPSPVTQVITASPVVPMGTVFQADTVVERITHDPITGTITKEVPVRTEIVDSKRFKWVPGKWQEEN